MDSEDEWVVTRPDETTVCGEHQKALLLNLINQNVTDAKAISTAIGNFYAVAVDKQLAFVQEQRIICASFSSIIDDYDVLEDGRVVVAERNGLVSLGIVDAGDCRFTVIKAKNLSQACSGDSSRTFCRIMFTKPDTEDAEKNIVAVTRQGLVIKLSNDLQNGKALQTSGIVNDMALTTDRIVVVGADSMRVVCDMGAELELEACLSDIMVEATETAEGDACSVDMVRIQTLDAPFFITMSTSGLFYLWDCLTLTVVHTWQIPGVLDFRLILDQGGFPSFHKLHLLALFESEVQVSTLSSLRPKLVYSLNGKLGSLARCPISQDDVLVVEKQVVEDMVDVETHVSLRLYAEASPQKRLNRLLSRRRFEEAEELAKLYGLKYELDPNILEALMREGKETYEETQDHLDSCRQKLMKNSSNHAAAKIVLSKLEELQKRLQAYDQVFGRENFSSEEWDIFQLESPLQLCLVLVNRDPLKALKIWKCFKTEIELELVPGILEELLLSLPGQLPHKQVGDWLCEDVIPMACRVDPDTVSQISNWVNIQVEEMEATGKQKWTSLAIVLLNNLLESLEAACRCSVDDLRCAGEQIVKIKISNSRCLGQIRSLVKSLKELQELSADFKFQIQLHRLQKETKESLVYCMLSRVTSANLLPAALKSTILPYIRSRQLAADEIFASYIQHQDMLLRLSPSMVVAIIETITSPKEKVTATVNLVKKVTFPLPEFVGELVRDILTNVKHPLCETLKEQWAIKEATNILFNNCINPAEMRTTRDVVECAKYIVACDQLPQALKVLEAFSAAHKEEEILTFACRLKVERGQFDELAEFLANIPKTKAVQCCQFVLTKAKHMSVEGYPSALAEVMKLTQMLYYEAASQVSSFLLLHTHDYFDQMEIRQTADTISKIKNLQLQYFMAVSCETLADKARCRELFRQDCGHYQGFELLRLGKLLNLDNVEVIQTLLEAYLDQSEEGVCPSIRKIICLLCRLLPKICLPEASILSLLDQLNLTFLFKADYCQIFEVFVRITNLIATFCQPENFAEVVELFGLVVLARDISKREQVGDATSQTEALAWDPHLVVEKASPRSSQTLTSLEALFGEDYLTEDLVTEMTQDLTEQNQHILALRLLTYFKHADSQHKMLPPDTLHTLETALHAGLLEKLLKSKEGSPMISLACSLSLPQEQSVHIIKSELRSCGINFKKLKKSSAIATAFAEVIGSQSLIHSCETVKNRAKWGTRLAKIGITLKSGTYHDAIDELIKSRHCTIEIIKEFHKDFKLDSCLETYVAPYFEHYLSHHFDPSPSERLNARDILAALVSPLSLLGRVLKQTSPYDYPKLQFLLEEMLRLNGDPDIQRGLKLLRCLDKHTRNSPPCDFERKKWGGLAVADVDMASMETAAGLEDVNVMNLLPKESLTRLPYHILMSEDVMEITKKEVVMESLDTWLSMADILKISKDKILIQAFINRSKKYSSSLASSSPSTSSSSTSARVSAEFLSLCSDLKTLLALFEKREHALWCCNAVQQKLQTVEEKVMAMKGSIGFLQGLMKSMPEGEGRSKIQADLDLFSKRLLLLSTNAALVRAGLQEAIDPKTRQGDANNLVRAIYGLAWNILEKATDVNGAVDTIASLHGVEVYELRVSLIEELMLSNSRETTLDLDQTMTFDVTVCHSDVDESDIVNRVLLLLRSSSRDACLETVMEIAKSGLQGKEKDLATFCLLKFQAE